MIASVSCSLSEFVPSALKAAAKNTRSARMYSNLRSSPSRTVRPEPMCSKLRASSLPKYQLMRSYLSRKLR